MNPEVIRAVILDFLQFVERHHDWALATMTEDEDSQGVWHSYCQKVGGVPEVIDNFLQNYEVRKALEQEREEEGDIPEWMRKHPVSHLGSHKAEIAGQAIADPSCTSGATNT
jgi:hypothetical protein